MNEGDPNERCETVKVKAGDSFAIINKSDFNPEVHELFEEAEGGGSGGSGNGGTTDKRDEYEAMNKDALKSLLDARTVPYHANDNKAELVDLLLAKDIADAEAAE